MIHRYWWSSNRQEGTTDSCPPHRTRLGRGNPLGVFAVGLLVCCGCGGSSNAPSDANQVVDPPEPALVDTATVPTKKPDSKATGAEDSLPDSSMELPDSFDPPADEPPKGSGFDIPEDMQIDSSSGGSTGQTSIKFAGWNEIQAEAASSGQVTVLDLWSLSCEPCMKEFPNLVQLQKSFAPKVRCMAVNIDFDGRKSRPPQYYVDGITEFLNRVDAERIDCFVCNTPSDEVYAAADVASIPAVLVYDANGKIIKVFADAGETAGFSYEKDIFPLVKQMSPS